MPKYRFTRPGVRLSSELRCREGVCWCLTSGRLLLHGHALDHHTAAVAIRTFRDKERPRVAHRSALDRTVDVVAMVAVMGG